MNGTIGERLKAFRKSLGLTQADFAARISMTGSGLANYELGRTAPSGLVLDLISREFHVSKTWLQTGNGDMYLSDVDPVRDKEDQLSRICRDIMPNAGDFGRRLVKALARLSVSDWEVLQRVAADIAANDPETAGGTEAEPATEQVRRAQGKVVPLFRTTLYNEGVSAGTGNYVDDASAESIDLMQEPPRGTDYVLRVSGDSMIPDYPPGCLVYVKIASRVEYSQVGIFSIYGEMFIKRYTRRGLESLNPDYDLIPFQQGMICQGLVLGVVPESID